jgi:hypothetical protein
MKSIPLTKYSKSPNKLEEDRKKVYEIIASKIATTNTT